jgi:hypothetical protein
MKSIEEAQASILEDIPEENWDISGVQQKLFQVWTIDEKEFTERAEQVRVETVAKYKDVIYETYEFQIENGNLSEGSFDIFIANHIAKIVKHKITPATKLLIEAHGGQLIEEKPKGKRKAKPVKWQEEGVTDDSTSS